VSGSYTLTEDFASTDVGNSFNLDAGTFSIIIDGTTVATDSLGHISVGQILRGNFDETMNLTAGSHTFETEISRVFINGSDTPDQFLDNISLTPNSVVTPEPASLLLLGTGLVTLAGRWPRRNWKLRYTLTNAYSGNNGRAAILNNTDGANVVYTSGNAGNGANPQPDGVIIGAGAQILTPEVKAEVAQSPGLPTPVGSFNITQLGYTADKTGKDTTFRGLRIFDNVIYYTKGSGGNGINTVYFVDTTGTACPDGGVGLPTPGAALPLSGLNYNTDPTVIQAQGLVPYNMCVLNGFPTILAKSAKLFPFGVWFANSTTAYVTDEGNGTLGKTVATFYAPAAAQTTAGLQKWILVAGKWQLAYTLKAGLGLGVPYIVPGYPTGLNNGTGGTGFPWAPATAGLRNINGVLNGDGTATIYAITSTVSGSGDQGADPNQLVVIRDNLSAGGPTPPTGESFTTLKSAGNAEVLRGVSFTPSSKDDDDDHDNHGDRH
jgi:hypothetical protein